MEFETSESVSIVAPNYGDSVATKYQTVTNYKPQACSQPVYGLSASDIEQTARTQQHSVFHCLNKRTQTGMAKMTSFPDKIIKPFVARRLPEILRATEYNMGTVDKIFASHWLDDRNVIYGTKCNKLRTLDVLTGTSEHISLIQGLIPSDPDNNCGIHSLELNPSHTMLATGGNNPNDLGVYELPGFEPVCVGLGHSDWLFGIVWLNDHLVVTGSRDGSLGVWDTKKQNPDQTPTGFFREPLTLVKNNSHSDEDDKVRAVQYNSHSLQLASLSTNALLHIWDVNQFKLVSSVDLPHQQENVCLCLEPGNSLYAVGSQSHVTLLDARSPSQCVDSLESIDKDAGIRSLSFHHTLVTIGTGFGSCSFLDLRNHKFLQNADGSICQLRAGDGWLHQDDIFYTYFGGVCSSNAIYTHCYDPTESKLFTGGGPLAVGLYGNYAALWH